MKLKFEMKNSKFLFGNLLFVLLAASVAHAGTITGKAAFDGTPGENPKLDMGADPVCKSLHSGDVYAERVIANPNGTLKNVFIYLKEGVKDKIPASSSKPAVLDQKGCRYDPHVMGMQVKQKLEIVNSDATLHNVHALGKQNPEFNLGMPLQGMKLEKTFSNPEVMLKFKCDVHPWMNGYVGIVEHPFFAVTDDQGSFQIEGAPAGEYTLEAWHETYGTKTAQVTIDEAGPAQVVFQFSAKEIVDEATGLKVKAEEPKPISHFDDSAALNIPRMKPVWWLPERISTIGGDIDALFYIILLITGAIFVGVQGTLIAFLFKYRAKPGAKAYYVHGNDRLEIIWTLIPAVILVLLMIWSQKVWSHVKAGTPNEAFPIEIHAEQFAWNVQYAGKDSKFGTADDIKTVNQLHIPVGKPVRVRLTSIGKDGKHPVIHSFFLPEVRLKQDVVPGMVTEVWFEATRTGKFEIACAEFCGLGHYRMRGFLSIHSTEGFEAWLKENAGGGVAQ